MIKYILETVTSKRDVNGNCYHLGVVTRTSDGKTISSNIGGPSTLTHHARHAGLGWEEVYTVQCVVSKRELTRLKNGVSYREPDLLKFFTGEIDE